MQTATVNRKAIEEITGKLSFRCSKLHNGNIVQDDNKWSHYAYRVSLTFGDGEKYATTYRMGTALTSPPQVQDVLHSLLMDASGTDQPFEDWASDYGYDTDSRKAHNIYMECVRCGERLRTFLTSDQISKLNELFQDF